MTDTWRLLVTEPTDGATNMAIDEAVWLGRRAGSSPPTLRFFAWEPPTISLGYGQPLDRHVDLAACHRLGVGIVRRLTGGSAIYHDGPERELTYSVVASADDIGGGARDLLHSYQWIGRALATGLRALGAPVEMVGVARGDEPTPRFASRAREAARSSWAGASSSAARSGATAKPFSSTDRSCSASMRLAWPRSSRRPTIRSPP